MVEKVPKNYLKENVSYQKTFFELYYYSCLYFPSNSKTITGLLAIFSFSLRPVFWGVSLFPDGSVRNAYFFVFSLISQE